MYKIHPLHDTVQESVIKLDSLWKGLKSDLRSLDDITYFNQTYTRTLLAGYINTFVTDFNLLVSTSLTQAVETVVRDLEDKHGIGLEIDERMDLADQIEEKMLKPFAGRTLLKRLHRLERMMVRIVNENMKLQLSGLQPHNIDSAYGWSYRLLVTEILRAYHVTVQEYALFIGGSSIEVKLYKKRHLTDTRMSEFSGTYKPKDLPDYPRPMAEYLLTIKY